MANQSPARERRATPAGWSVWLSWVVANTLGSVLSGTLVLAGASAHNPVMYVALGGASAVPIGVAQWLVLRRQVALSGLWWVLASLLGMSVGGAAMSMIGLWGAALAAPVISGWLATVLGTIPAARGALAGAFVGILQWLVLRHSVPRAGIWILANSIGFALATHVTSKAGLYLPDFVSERKFAPLIVAAG